ncbi:hypothetical protein CR513_37788, partial [Mucuna pruriens]
MNVQPRLLGPTQEDPTETTPSRPSQATWPNISIREQPNMKWPYSTFHVSHVTPRVTSNAHRKGRLGNPLLNWTRIESMELNTRLMCDAFKLALGVVLG